MASNDLFSVLVPAVLTTLSYMPLVSSAKILWSEDTSELASAGRWEGERMLTRMVATSTPHSDRYLKSDDVSWKICAREGTKNSV